MIGEPPSANDGGRAEVEGIGAGSRLAGYVVLEEIGRGGMAVVFLARDERLGRRVALKVLVPALARDDAFRHRFMQESRAAAAADDPHIIPIFEAGEANGVLFIAMRYVGGGDMRTIVRREGPLPAPRVAAILSPVASALDAAHALGLVHRDVKPANMLIDVRPGRPDHVYLTDFGLSKDALSGAGLTTTGQFLGTPDYMSPEQIAGPAVDGRADQYALACAAFELLTGAPPFQRDHGMAVIYAHLSEPPPSLASAERGLPEAVDAVLARALAKNPTDRFASCREFSESLRWAMRLRPYDAEQQVPDTSSPEHGRTADSRTGEWPAPPDHLTTLKRTAGSSARRGRITRRGAVLGAAAVVLIGAGAGVAALLGRATPRPLAPAPGFLADVASSSAGTAWAVGSSCSQGCVGLATTGQKLILSRNGSGWRSASISQRLPAELNGVSAQPGATAWAVGYSCTPGCNGRRALILRWNGSSWSPTSSRSPGQNAVLNAVSTGPSGTWAAGYYTESGVKRALILRWTGTDWRPAYSPSTGPKSILNGVSAGPGDTAWAVGYSCATGCGTASADHLLILRWDGSTWSPMPSPIADPSELYGVSAGPGNRAWADGFSCVANCGTSSAVDHTLILHWNGSNWTQMLSPHPGLSSALYGLSAGPGGIAWAAGTSCASGCHTLSQVHHTLILRWDGFKWSPVASRGPGRNSRLFAITAGPGGSAWAAGYSCTSSCGTPSEVDRTLILRWNGSAWVPG